jgi:superfamily II DNA or RNA helicase
MLADHALKHWEKTKPVLILVDMLELVDQAVEKIFESCGRYAEVLQGSRRPTGSAEIIVATMQTMAGRMKEYPPDKFQLVVVDECDRSVSPEWQSVLKYFDPFARVCGVTATPERSDSLNVMNYYEHVFDDVPMFELIRMGYLVRVKVRTVPLKIDLNGVKATKGDFKEKDLAAAITPFFEAVCQSIQMYAPDRQNLVFHPLRESSKQFTSVALDNGINAAHIDGDSSDRKQLRQRFKDHEIQVISNAMLWARGFDEPSISCITILRPTKSPSFFRQMVGRGTRLFCPQGCPEACEHVEAKKDLLLLDFLWQYEKHGLQTPANLITSNERVSKALMQRFQQAGLALDLQATNESVAAEVEAEIIDEIRRHAGDTGRFFDVIQLAETAEEIDLANYRPADEWEYRPYTAAQAEALARIGVDVRSVTNTGHAEAILRCAEARAAAGLCSFKQMRYLRKFGFEHLARMTKKEASKMTFLVMAKGYRPNRKKISPEVAARGFDQVKKAAQGMLFPAQK